MAETPPGDSESPTVPDLVDDYRARLDSLHDQARDLVRMRGDVLAAAERESHAVVTIARGEIREILVKARRELLVLAAQVQAVTDHDATSDSASGLTLVDPRSASEISHDRLRAGARQEVRHVLSEVRPDLDALTIEARILRSNLIALHAAEQVVTPDRSEVSAAADASAAEVSTVGLAPSASGGESPFDPRVVFHDLDSPDAQILPRLFGSEISPLGVPADNENDARHDETPAIAGFSRPERSPAKAFVLAFAALAAVVVLGTGWWLYSRWSQEAVAPAVPTAAAEERPESGAVASDEPLGAVPSAVVIAPDDPAEAATADGSLTIEARRASWIRAQVDGRPDPGRLYGPGETRRITGASRVSIRAGDAGAVFIAVNGQAPEALGPDGRVLTRDYVLRATPETSPSPPAAEPSPAPPAAVEPGRSESPDETRPALPAPRASAAPVAAPPSTARIEPSPVVPPPAPSPASPAPGVARAQASEDDLVLLSQRWLDAYLSGNSSTMMAVSGGAPVIRDQRLPHERLASGSESGSGNARRSFEALKLQSAADIGVFSVRMTERAQADATGQPREHVALISQVWMRRAGKWQLIDVRIVSESQIKPTP